MLDAILAEYRRQLELHDDWQLKILVENYNLPGLDRQAWINAIVGHYKTELGKYGIREEAANGKRD